MTATRHSRDFLVEAMERPAIAALISNIREELRNNPEACVVVGKRLSMVQFRTGGGKRTWVSARALLWAESVGPCTDLDPPTFGASKCGTAGCVNPSHQRLRENTQRVKVLKNATA